MLRDPSRRMARPTSNRTPLRLVGVVKHADTAANGAPGPRREREVLSGRRYTPPYRCCRSTRRPSLTELFASTAGERSAVPRPAIRAVPPRTTGGSSSSATTSTQSPPAPSAPASGTTPATPSTAPQSTAGGPPRLRRCRTAPPCRQRPPPNRTAAPRSETRTSSEARSPTPPLSTPQPGRGGLDRPSQAGLGQLRSPRCRRSGRMSSPAANAAVGELPAAKTKP